MHLNKILFCAIAATICLQAAATAQSGRKPQGRQEGQGQPQDEKPIVKLETREVVIPLIAYNAAGKYVDDLTAKDVLVFEEGESRPVADLKREPANIVLVLDQSNEIGTFKNGPSERFKSEDDRPIWEKGANYRVMANPTTRRFAEFFVSQLSPRDYISIIQYYDRVQTIQDWTNDPQQAIASLNSKYRVGLSASFYDALKLAADKLQTRRQGRRVIVLVSDGLDSSSKSDRAKALAAVARSRASVFVVGWAEALKTEIETAMNWMTANEEQNVAGAKRYLELKRHIPKIEGAAIELRSLAESTGGEMWLPATHEELIMTWRPLTEEIGAQYSLAFVTERKPSIEDLRSIRVIPARQGVNVRSRNSYYVGDDSQ
jgi:VWFA-related protein